VAHDAYKKLGLDDLTAMFKNEKKVVVADIKGILDRKKARDQGLEVWRL
jgi:hypothetical protein